MIHRDQDFILKSLTEVGENKAIGYLPLNTIVNILCIPIEVLKSEIESKNLKWQIYEGKDCCIKSGVFFAYHPNKMHEIIRKHGHNLELYGIALSTEGVIENLATNWYDSDHELISFIKELYADNL